MRKRLEPLDILDTIDGNVAHDARMLRFSSSAARASKEVDRAGHTNRLQHLGGSIGPPRSFSS